MRSCALLAGVVALGFLGGPARAGAILTGNINDGSGTFSADTGTFYLFGSGGSQSAYDNGTVAPFSVAAGATEGFEFVGSGLPQAGGVYDFMSQDGTDVLAKLMFSVGAGGTVGYLDYTDFVSGSDITGGGQVGAGDTLVAFGSDYSLPFGLDFNLDGTDPGGPPDGGGGQQDVPEPASFGIFAVALLAFGFFVRSRRLAAAPSA